MRRHLYLAIVGVMLVVAGFALLNTTPTMAQEEEPMDDPVYLQEYHDAWMNSPHNATDAEAFIHWDEDGEVEAACATCHSTTGYVDFLGGDGSEAGVVDNPVPTGTTVTCDACHNPAAVSLTDITFPSGAVVSTTDNAARCMVCHQGRASGASVAERIATAGVEDMNTVSADLGFINIHYYAAAASLYGSEVGGGYEFEGQIYQMKNNHVPGYDTCTSCHNPHTLEINIDECAECHNVVTEDDLQYIRMEGSEVDFDGDGDVREGIADEISTLQEMLYATMQAYASEVAGTPLVYDTHAYPYFFIDTNANGEVDEGEATFANQYNAFTGNLVAAAYNYQMSLKDPGSYAHNATYHIQLLYDSIMVLNEALAEPIDMSTARRNEAGHFDVTAEAFRHWDEDGEVSASCTRCHTAEGLPFYLENGVTIAFEPSNSLTCSTCHTSLSEFTRFEVESATFPSGAVLSFGEGEEANLCLNCHQGRESTVSVNSAIARAGVGDDEVSESLSFRNVHYFAAGATMFGTEAQGAYEFEGMEYNGLFEHADRFETCTDCHNTHTLENRINLCVDCHETVEELGDVQLIRMEPEGVEGIDYDGDGDATEPIRDEIMTLEDALYAAIQAYASETAGTPIMYVSYAHPYWYIDANGNGVIDEGEVNSDGRYVSWTPNLLRAAYNYQYIAKDPGVYAHNGDYALQILYDSLLTIGGEEAVAGFTRPPVRVSEGE